MLNEALRITSIVAVFVIPVLLLLYAFHKIFQVIRQRKDAPDYRHHPTRYMDARGPVTRRPGPVSGRKVERSTNGRVRKFDPDDVSDAAEDLWEEIRRRREYDDRSSMPLSSGTYSRFGQASYLNHTDDSDRRCAAPSRESSPARDDPPARETHTREDTSSNDRSYSSDTSSSDSGGGSCSE